MATNQIQTTTTQKHPLEVKTEPKKAEGTVALMVIGVLLLVASIFTLNPVLIAGAFIALIMLAIASSCIQRAENMEVYLHDVREALNLQTIRLEAISRALVPGSDAAQAAKLAPETAQTLQKLCDIAEEARDLLSHMNK